MRDDKLTAYGDAMHSTPHWSDYAHSTLEALDNCHDISSLALSFVPFPFCAGGLQQIYTMDSATTAGGTRARTQECVGLLGDSGSSKQKQKQYYGTVPAGEALADGQGPVATSASQEAKMLARGSIPLTITYLLQYNFSLVTVFVVGHIGTKELGAVSLATMTASITGLAIYEGLATSLDTLCAQAYGSGRKELVGLHLQRMILLMLVVTLPIAAIWLSSASLLAPLVPDAHLAHIAAKYLSILAAGAPGYAIFEAAKRFTQAQGLFHASLWVLLVATPINMLLNYLFVFVLDWKLAGAALATAVSQTLLPVLLAGYICMRAPHALECWPGFSKEAFGNWGPMARLAIPGILMVETEWLAFNVLTFATSFLGPRHLAAQSIVMSLAIAMYHVPFAVGVAVSTRLGTLVGAGCLAQARAATRVYVAVFVALGLLDCVLLVALRNVLARGFSDDERVRAIVATVLPVLAVFQFCDATTALANALLRGLGLQAVGGWANLAVYYGIGVPVALALCFGCGWKLVGLWAGFALGSSCITVIEGVYMYLYDWQKAVEDARRREE